MASSRFLISSTTLTGSQATVTFSSIPSGYKDLILKWSARGTSSVTNENGTIEVQFNSDTASNYSRITLQGTGSAAQSFNSGSADRIYVNGGTVGSGATADTFSNGELYMPNYLATSSRPNGAFSANENNTTAAGIAASAGLYRGTSALTSITLVTSATSFAAGSSFYLYGIKNA